MKTTIKQRKDKPWTKYNTNKEFISRLCKVLLQFIRNKQAKFMSKQFTEETTQMWNKRVSRS